MEQPQNKTVSSVELYWWNTTWSPWYAQLLWRVIIIFPIYSCWCYHMHMYAGTVSYLQPLDVNIWLTALMTEASLPTPRSILPGLLWAYTWGVWTGHPQWYQPFQCRGGLQVPHIFSSINLSCIQYLTILLIKKWYGKVIMDNTCDRNCQYIPNQRQ